MFGNTTLTLIQGTVYRDRNRDGQFQGSVESPLAGWIVFVDRDGDGIFDNTEESTTTNTKGKYRFTLVPGSYRIQVLKPKSWQYTIPASGARKLTLGRTNDEQEGLRRAADHVIWRGRDRAVASIAPPARKARRVIAATPVALAAFCVADDPRVVRGSPRTPAGPPIARFSIRGPAGNWACIFTCGPFRIISPVAKQKGAARAVQSVCVVACGVVLRGGKARSSMPTAAEMWTCARASESP
jgi:hypothetical protein